MWRVTGGVAVALLLVLALAAGLGWWRVDDALRASFPQTSGTLRVPGLGSPASVDRDGDGIPQIYAADPSDLFLAEGFVQAQDRFWQMDVSRHGAEGTLAAVLGPGSVPHDELARALGWSTIAARSYAVLQPQTKAYLQAFARGVNDYLAERPGGRSLSIEYSVLGLPDTHTAAGYRPPAWSPVDTLAWLEETAWDTDGGARLQASRALLEDQLTSAQSAMLFPNVQTDPGFDTWAVSGRLTASGAPLLASAPPAAPALPSAWYQIGLHCQSVGPACPYDVAGYTEPGVPGVLLGHNDSMAWSWTGRPAGESELYLEMVTGSQYQYDGTEHPLGRHTETIEVAGASPVTLTVRDTGHGPLLSDFSDVFRQVGATAQQARAGGTAPSGGLEPGGAAYAVSVQAPSLVPNTTADALFALDRATGRADFTAAAAGMTAPALGLVYADQTGDIGYQGPAAMPARAAQDDGSLPVPGWTSAYAWSAPPGSKSVAPQSEDDPADGYVTGDPGAPDGLRAARIAADLAGGTASGRKLGASDLAAVQADTYDPEAAVLVPYLLRAGVDDFTRPAVALLKGWDYTEPAGSGAAAYYNAVWTELLKLVMGRQLPMATQDPRVVRAEQSALDGAVPWDTVIDGLLRQPDSSWWGPASSARVTPRDTMLAAALEKARLDLTSLMGKDVTTWTWGRVHTVTPENQALGVGSSPALLKWLLDGHSLGLPGGGSAVAAADWDLSSDQFAVGTAPGLRMVIDLGRPDDSRWVGQTGESGHVDDRDYLDQAALWAADESLPWPYSADAVRAASQERLELDPEQ
jgi:penicillin amidase